MKFLEVHQLCKRFGRTHAVQDVSFELEAGSVLGLAGPNGAGKSTLIRMLATVERPTSGQIVISGADAIRQAGKVRSAIGYVPDVYGLYEGTRVWEYLAFFARCYGLAGRLRQGAIGELLRLVDLYEFRDSDCKALSRGLQQKLLIARALLNEPSLLLLDEPLAGLDAQSRLEMLEVFRELASMGKAVVMASHHLTDLTDVADRIALMAAGQLTSIGTVPELIRELDVVDRVRLVVLDDPEPAHRILLRNPAVSDIDVSHHSLTFACTGGRAAQAGVLTELINGGIRVAQFAPIAQPLHELVAAEGALMASSAEPRASGPRSQPATDGAGTW